ncbi:MAG: LysM peptidoglycan-binding domain-containing protein [Bacteroidales bacterium]|nr:LysM peptidoglycan-binding domain-containing protein [Bacteroidales bacterium]
MKKILILSLVFVCAHVKSVAEETQDTTKIFLADSLEVSFQLADSVYSNFDENLDSMLQLYYVRESLEVIDSAEIAKLDSIPDFPDSVYIARLAAIPTVVELSYNPIVRSYINAYTKKKRKSVESMLGLSEHYFPIFDDIFDYYDVPNEMKYMSIIESALNPRAYSRAKAVGLWQFMYGTGRSYGLEINSLVDERRDPIKSTHAAAKMSKDLYRIYGDWLLVIAAYNCGPGNVNRAIRRAGGKTNYWDIYYFLPRETRGHVPAFIAATYVMNYYKEHNLIPKPIEMPLIIDTIMIREKLHLEQVAHVLQIPIKELRDLNPQYRADILPAGDKAYALNLPAEETLRFIDLEDSIFAYKDSVYFDPTKNVISPSSDYAGYTPEAPGSNYEKLSYTVKSGDNLGYISEWYNVKVSDIKYWNDIRKTVIRSGQKLTIYKLKSQASNYKDIDKLSFAEKQKRIGKTVSTQSTASSTPVDYSGAFITYTVRSGDTLWDIAKKYPDVSESDIIRLNNLSNGDKIKPGQVLKIKPKS